MQEKEKKKKKGRIFDLYETREEPFEDFRNDSHRSCIIDCCNFIGGANVSWKDAQKATLLLQPDFSSIPFLPISRCEPRTASPRNSKYISRTTGFKFRIEQDDASNADHERNSKSRGPHSVFSPTYTYSLRIEHIHVETTDRHPTTIENRRITKKFDENCVEIASTYQLGGGKEEEMTRRKKKKRNSTKLKINGIRWNVV